MAYSRKIKTTLADKKMRKILILLFALLSIFTSNAEGFPTRKSKQKYKDLKVYAKVLERDGKSDFYSIQIDIVNTGNSTISFLEESSSYCWTLAFSAAGIIFVNKNERLYFEKKIPNIPTVTEVEKKVSILPHQKYRIKTQFYIRNRKRFLETNQKLRIIFIFSDANLLLHEDMIQILSDTIKYKW